MNNKQLSTAYSELINRQLTEKGGDYLEIGIYNGVFISAMADKHKSSRVFGIDPFIADGWTGEEQGTILMGPRNNFIENSKGLPVTFWEKTTKQCLDEKRYLELNNVTAILIDGSHHFDDIMTDIRFVSLIQNKHECLVVFDDFHLVDVQRAFSEFRNFFSGRIKKEERVPTIAWFIIYPFPKQHI